MSINFPIVFDFDGTMVHSNELKEKAFFLAVYNGHRSNKIINKILAKGKVLYWDRHIILKKISESLDLSYIELLQSYNELLDSMLPKCQKREGIDEFLKQSNGLKIINSATPTTHLVRNISKIFPNEKFDLIMGNGSSKKIKNLEFIINKFSLVSNNLIIIGDGQDDYESAIHFGCIFFGFSGGTITTNNIRLYENYFEVMQDIEAYAGERNDKIP
ncbi:HAD hydrolase-like protein [Alphaproteobacteria bacterium]|nr:HAD hydrolase-like protein [Alphaproteobacteria bacterium]